MNFKDLANAWKKFDVNGDEVIKAEEVEQFLADLNINMPAEAREEFVATLDKYVLFVGVNVIIRR